MKKNSLDILLQDVEIPNIVQEKAQKAFSQIHMQIEEGNIQGMENKKCKKKSRFLHTKAAAVIAAVFVGGGSMTALGAACMHWSQGLQTKMNVSEEQMLELQNAENTPVSFPQVSDTQGDITVSVAQCLVDENDVQVALYVEGYELECEPELERLTILLDGQRVGNCEWSFYATDGSLKQQAADGRLELDLRLSPVDENGKAVTNLIGKNIDIQLENLGEHTGVWNLNWTLESTSAVMEAQVNEVLGNSGATVCSVKVSPMSVKIYYDFPRQEIQQVVAGENGMDKEYTTTAEPPRFVGIKMTDGTVYTQMFNGGTFGYEDAASSIYVAKVSFSRIVNPEEVQSLLFLREDNAVTGENEITQADCYEVNIK